MTSPSSAGTCRLLICLALPLLPVMTSVDVMGQQYFTSTSEAKSVATAMTSYSVRAEMKCVADCKKRNECSAFNLGPFVGSVRQCELVLSRVTREEATPGWTTYTSKLHTLAKPYTPRG